MTGRIIGVCVATQKDPKLTGRKLLVVEPIRSDGTSAGKPAIAIDLVGAGAGETVLLAKSRDASLASDDSPVDLAVIAIADAIVTPPHRPISPAERGFGPC
ncbi:MAG TPA: EutN/CcmL family microcompartment protein [Symbiobacteriaceae bacterium]|nr:EutN/CcmL family microcompartment protein [Symbiobacteriaceae bacterium]